MEQARVTISGDRILMHNSRLADPLDEYTKRIAHVTSKKTKDRTPEEWEALARLEFEGGLYFDPGIGPYLPNTMLHRAITDGAKKRKLGKEFKKFFTIEEDRITLLYEGPRTIAGMLKEGTRFVDRRMVGLRQSKVPRVRPIFRQWSATFTAQLFDGSVKLDHVEAALDEAGPWGIGDGHPLLGGKFTVVSFTKVK